MITLENNELHFNFPEISAELHRLAEPEIGRLTTQFLAEDRDAAFKHLLEHEYRNHDIDACYILDAKSALLALTPEKITAAIRQHLDGHGVFGFGAKGGAIATVTFQRTLRIPDDGKRYPLPPSLGTFPLAHVDDHAHNVPPAWSKRGGVMMPMHQAEALWLRFFGSRYPCALKVAAGKINAVSGQAWSAGLHRGPQDYVILPNQPWLDGYCVAKGLIRQFVAMPLGKGYSAEEQLTGKAEHGGLQLQVYPLRASVYFEQTVCRQLPAKLGNILALLLPVPTPKALSLRRRTASLAAGSTMAMALPPPPDMGLGAGGQMHQDIYEDERPLADYDLAVTSRCFVHLCNSAAWKSITGSLPPASPITAQTYAQYKLPWFDYYRDDLAAVNGSPLLAMLKTVAQLHKTTEHVPLPDNETVTPEKLIQYGNRRRPNEVLEWKDDEPMLS